MSSLTPTAAYCEQLALKIVPKGHERSRTELRQIIAQTLAAEVEKALTRQQTERFPELADLQAALRKRSAELDAKELELGKDRTAWAANVAKAEAALKKRDADLKTQEDRLAAAVAAVVDWDKYCKGHGEIDENGNRFDKLNAACAAFAQNRLKEQK